MITCKKNPIIIQRSAKITVASSVLLGTASTAHSLDHMIRDEAFCLLSDSVPIMLKKVPIMPVSFSQQNSLFSQLKQLALYNPYHTSVLHQLITKKCNYGTNTAVCAVYGL